MDYLDWDLAVYQDYEDRMCGVCGEYVEEEWSCGCCETCKSSECECEEEELTTRQINYQR